MLSSHLFPWVIAWIYLSGGPASVAPVGFPPRPFDPQLASFLPEEPIVAYLQMGTAEKAGGESNASRWRAFSWISYHGGKLFSQWLNAELGQDLGSSERGLLDRWLEIAVVVQRSPMIFTIYMPRQYVAQARSGRMFRTVWIVQVGEKASQELARLARETASLLGLPLAERTSGPITISQIDLTGDAARFLEFGASGDLFVLTIGASGSFWGVLDRKAPGPPMWLDKVRSQLPIDRPVSYLRVNENATGIVGLGQIWSVIYHLGMASSHTITTAAGFDAQGFVAKHLVAFPSSRLGPLERNDTSVLRPEDLQSLPADALVVGAVRFRPDSWSEWIHEDPLIQLLHRQLTLVSVLFRDDEDGYVNERDYQRVTQRLARGVEGLSGDLQFAWYLSEDAKTTDTSVTLGVADRTRVAKLIDWFEKKTNAEPSDDETITSRTEHIRDEGRTLIRWVWTVEEPEGRKRTHEFWSCLTRDRLVLASSRSKLTQVLEGQVRPTLADDPSLAKLLERRPFALVYVPLPRVLHHVRHQIPHVAGLLEAWDQEPLAETVRNLGKNMPDPKSLSTTTLAAYRHDDGVLIERRMAAPGLTELALLGVSLPYRYPDIAEARQAFLVGQSAGHLRNVIHGILKVQREQKAFPALYSVDASGRPLLSWRVHILPALGFQELYDRFHLDEPWDSPHNRKLIEAMPDVFRSPGNSTPKGKTPYLAVKIEKGVWQVPEAGENGDSSDDKATIVNPHSTIGLIEVAARDSVIWTKPEDLEVDAKHPKAALSSPYETSVLAAMLCGNLTRVPLELTDQQWRLLMQNTDKSELEGVNLLHIP